MLSEKLMWIFEVSKKIKMAIGLFGKMERQ